MSSGVADLGQAADTRSVNAEPAAGGDARAESDRRAELRLLRDIELIGGLGPIDYHVDRRPSPERALRVGAEGEELTAKRLERHLRGSGVVVEHDLLIPNIRTRIDHVAVGPGGVTVIASRNYEGTAELRNGELFLGGRRQVRAIDGLAAQLGLVRMVLVEAQINGADLAAALSLTNLDGRPLGDSMLIDGILVDSPKRVARLAARAPAAAPLEVEAAVQALRARLRG